MGDTIRVEMLIPEKSKILTKFKNIDELKQGHNNLIICKYIYFDEETSTLKGINPPSEAPIVPNAYITVAGEFVDVIKFSEDLVVA